MRPTPLARFEVLGVFFGPPDSTGWRHAGEFSCKETTHAWVVRGPSGTATGPDAGSAMMKLVNRAHRTVQEYSKQRGGKK